MTDENDRYLALMDYVVARRFRQGHRSRSRLRNKLYRLLRRL